MTTLPSWLETIAVFDTETTGLDLREARIVTAAVGLLHSDGSISPESKEWLADPGIPIPEQASNVHGITDEFARANGRPAAEVVAEVLSTLREHLANGVPVIAYNAPYDFTILHYEAVRHGLEPLVHPFPILDPLVLDKKFDKYRKGKRQLFMTCEVYGVALDDAHTATADAVAAGRVLQAIAGKFPAEFEAGANALHQAQILWSDEQSLDFERFMRGAGKPDFTAQLGWPLKTFD